MSSEDLSVVDDTPSSMFGMGWRPDLPDHRDLSLRFDNDVVQSVPERHDRHEKLPEIFNQSSIGSCAANAIIRCFMYADALDGVDNIEMLSRLMLYYDGRAQINSVNSDSGMSIRDGIKIMVNQGCCTEDMWPYDITKFKLRPPQNCYNEAVDHKARKYASVQPVLGQIKAALNSGYPIAFGTPVYQSIFSQECSRTGIIPIPHPQDPSAGGHAMVFNGYWDDDSQLFGVDNSWGRARGDGGCYYLPYWYVVNGLVRDCWVIYSIFEKGLPEPQPGPQPQPQPQPSPQPQPQPVPVAEYELAKPVLSMLGTTFWRYPSGTDLYLKKK